MLRVVMYHYVRSPSDPYPRLKGVALDAFVEQVDALRARYEMATLESALDYVEGCYQPQRDLCLLTFDDGVKDHLRASQILSERGIEGQFFLITSAVEEHRVLSVHKNHLLMASLEFDAYRSAFLAELERRGGAPPPPDPAAVKKTYRWGSEEEKSFKYLLNFQLDKELRERVLDDLFVAHIGDEHDVAKSFYLSWDEAWQMHELGMRLGGHTHRHEPLASLSPSAEREDLTTCKALLDRRLASQGPVPFSYPYGKPDSFTEHTQRVLGELNFACAFTTEVGDNIPGQSRLALRRIDTKDCDRPASTA